MLLLLVQLLMLEFGNIFDLRFSSCPYHLEVPKSFLFLDVND